MADAYASGPFLEEFLFTAEIAREAGAAVRDYYDRMGAETYIKGDGSPVTDADLASDRIIRARLAERFPQDAVLTEEGADDPVRLTAERCWIVDPIDGTQQFIDRTGEFDVLIALVVGGRPVVGALYQPTEDRLLIAAEGGGAWLDQRGERRRVRFDPVPADATPRIFTSTWLGAPESLPALQRVAQRVGSTDPAISVRGVTVRDLVPGVGAFDAMIGVRMDGRLTMAWEWDFVCSDLFVHEAGGRQTDLFGRRHEYNKPFPKNTGGILISVDPVTHDRLLAALAPELALLPPDPGN
jgi:myo-inositol-1(or 4)-monophosphatase